ncbi:MAG: 6,7-dimethyl-8-ribityllumazine synthase [Muribaculaceae bacterium]|nr:6,7-dimethyl-8-ribityllumazine synthase [Muribaculaceae bacterium]
MSQHSPNTELPRVDGLRLAIVAAEWNGHITSLLTHGAVNRLKELGYNGKYDELYLTTVPGTVELTYAAAKLIDSKAFDAVIVIGVVIRGETPHFDYVCQSVTQGVTMLNARAKTPVIFCVLTVENEQQAYDRAGGAAGHKGVEAVDTAIKMVAFSRSADRL